MSSDMARDLRAACPIATDMLERAVAEDGLPCIKTVISVTRMVWKQDPINRITCLRKRHPDFLRACVAFLMLPRRKHRRVQLSRDAMQQQNGCSCDLRSQLIRDLHPPKMVPLTDMIAGPPIALLLDALYLIVTYTCKSICSSIGGYRTFLRAAAAASSGNTHAWPARIEDLVPYGTAQALEALYGWEGFANDEFLLSAVCDVYMSHAHVASPSILLCDILPGIFYRLVTHVLDGSTGPAYGTTCRALSVLRSAASMICPVLDMHPQMIAHICQSHNAHSSFERVVVFLISCVHTFMRLRREGRRGRLNTCSGPRCAHAREDDYNVFRRCAVRLWRAIGSPSIPQDAELGKWALEDNPRRGLSALAPYIWIGHVCANTDCRSTAISEGRALKTCAGCKSAFYCSRSCQRRAWKDVRAPHRAVCEHMHELRRRVQPDFDFALDMVLDAEVFVEQCDEAGLNDEVLEMIEKHCLVVYSR